MQKRNVFDVYCFRHHKVGCNNKFFLFPVNLISFFNYSCNKISHGVNPVSEKLPTNCFCYFGFKLQDVVVVTVVSGHRLYEKEINFRATLELQRCHFVRTKLSRCAVDARALPLACAQVWPVANV